MWYPFALAVYFTLHVTTLRSIVVNPNIFLRVQDRVNTAVGRQALGIE